MVSIFSMPASVMADGALLLVDLVIGLVETRNEGVDGVVEIRAVVERTGNDQRRARFVDQDGVDFVDDRIGMPALDHILQPVLHVVAQIIEAEFVVGAVGDVVGIGLLALLVVHAMDDDACGQAEEAVDLAHPLAVALGEIVVDGDDMHAASGECIEIDRQASQPASCLRRFSFRRCCLHAGSCRRSAARRNAAGRACAWRLRARSRKPAPRMSSSVLPSASSALKRSVRAFSSASDKAATSSSSALMASTRGMYDTDAPIIGGTKQFAGNGADHARSFSKSCGNI